MPKNAKFLTIRQDKIFEEDKEKEDKGKEDEIIKLSDTYVKTKSEINHHRKW